MISTILGLLIGGAAVFFAFQNNDLITVKFLDNELTGSVALIIIFALLVGLLIGMLLFVPRVFALHWRNRTLSRENEKLKNRLNEAPIQYEAPGLGTEGEGHIELQ